MDVGRYDFLVRNALKNRSSRELGSALRHIILDGKDNMTWLPMRPPGSILYMLSTALNQCKTRCIWPLKKEPQTCGQRANGLHETYDVRKSPFRMMIDIGL